MSIFVFRFRNFIFFGQAFYVSVLQIVGVGAQSNLGGHDIFARKICIKINKMPELYMIPARKIIKIPDFFTIFARKINQIPEFYTIFARKRPNFTQ